ncbi:hypothetical protein VP1G_05526 [Cytospora mali]|uniref:Uncharacterized protein n=1 Tax=Cytospora mali TaxID=578113 RepID=A0A194V2T9_CYTMA|nr:hypothetical protein VP1G_05526 [Valsa mali var. pyri (nom. inval.)]
MFNSLLTKDHVTSALMQDGNCHNEVPLVGLEMLLFGHDTDFVQALTTVLLMAGSPAQLKTVYEHNVTSLKPWAIAPGRVNCIEDQQRHLGDSRYLVMIFWPQWNNEAHREGEHRYQRAYMDFFSMQHGHFKGSYKALLDARLICGPQPLMYGFLGGFGRAMITLSDSMEVRNPILVVQSLVLASVDYSNAICAILSDSRFDQPHEAPLNPELIIGRIAYDGRFSLNISGPGFQHAAAVLSNPAARSAILGYVHHLDTTNVQELLEQLSRVSVLMLCAAHKKDLPAFDMYLSRPISLVQSLRVLLQECHQLKTSFIRGTWLLFILVYIAQLRPYLDKSLVWSFPLPEERSTWDHFYVEPLLLLRLERDDCRG